MGGLDHTPKRKQPVTNIEFEIENKDIRPEKLDEFIDIIENWEDEIDEDGDFCIMLDIYGTCSPGSPGRMYMPNGDPGYPPEPPEVEIEKIYFNDYPETNFDYDWLTEKAILKIEDSLIDTRIDDDRNAEIDAAEMRAEMRAEMERDDY